jgi:signal peptidase
MMEEREKAARLAGQLFRQDGWMNIRSHGISMFPFIKEGDFCRFRAMTGPELDRCRRGDVLLFRTDDGRLIGHRLHRVEQRPEGKRYLLKGDANVRFDDWVSGSQVLGKLTAIRRGRRSARADGFLPLFWGRLMLGFPFLSRVLRKAAFNRSFGPGRKGRSG